MFNGSRAKLTLLLVNASLGKGVNGKISGGQSVTNRVLVAHGVFGEKLEIRTIDVDKREFSLVN